MVSVCSSVSQRAKRSWLAGLCAAGLVSGQLFADDVPAEKSSSAAAPVPQTIINEYFQSRASAVTPSAEADTTSKDSGSEPASDESAVTIELPGSPALDLLKPAAAPSPAKEIAKEAPLVPARPLPLSGSSEQAKTAANPPLAPIVTAAEMRKIKEARAAVGKAAGSKSEGLGAGGREAGAGSQGPGAGLTVPAQSKVTQNLSPQVQNSQAKSRNAVSATYVPSFPALAPPPVTPNALPQAAKPAAEAVEPKAAAKAPLSPLRIELSQSPAAIPSPAVVATPKISTPEVSASAAHPQAPQGAIANPFAQVPSRGPSNKLRATPATFNVPAEIRSQEAVARSQEPVARSQEVEVKVTPAVTVPLVSSEPTTKPIAVSPPASSKPAAETAAKPKAARTNYASQADYEARLLAAQPGSPAMTPVLDDEFGKLPEGSPFETIQESGRVKLRVRRSMLLRTKTDIYRTAIVDESVCDLVQFTPREVSIIGRSMGQTHVTFWFDDANMAPLTYLVEVSPDVEQVKRDEDKYILLENVVNEMFPDSKVHLVIVADKLLVKGQAKDSEEAAQVMTIVRAQAGIRGSGLGGSAGLGGAYGGLSEGAATPVLSQAATGGNSGPAYQIINMLRVPGVQQVALKVKIAELNRTAARGFGVDVNGLVNVSDSVAGTQLFLASILNAANTDGGGTPLIASFNGQEINFGLRYLQERGVIRLLSEPTLVTLSGRPATFVAGGEFAVPTIVGSAGLNAVTTDFRAFGAIISFLPTIVDKDRIRLQIAPEFSQINSALTVNNTPGLNIRSATTTVEMREGQTLAIAGLLEDSYKATNVGDLPGLARIFGRRDTTHAETELIILVTPELVHPMDAEEVPPLPGFDVTEPTAKEFFLHGDIEGNPTQDYRSTVWPRLRKRYGMGGPAMTSGSFGHGQ